MSPAPGTKVIGRRYYVEARAGRRCSSVWASLSNPPTEAVMRDLRAEYGASAVLTLVTVTTVEREDRRHI